MGDGLERRSFEGVRVKFLGEDMVSVQVERDGFLDLAGDAGHGVLEPHLLEGQVAAGHEELAPKLPGEIRLPFQKGHIDAAMGEKIRKRGARGSGLNRSEMESDDEYEPIS